MSTAPQYQVDGVVSLTAAAAIGPFIRVKLDSSGYAAIAGAGELGVAVAMEYVASGAVGKFRLLNDVGTHVMEAGAAVTAGSVVYAAASGKITGTAGSGILGYAKQTGVSGDRIEIFRTTAA